MLIRIERKILSGSGVKLEWPITHYKYFLFALSFYNHPLIFFCCLSHTYIFMYTAYVTVYCLHMQLLFFSCSSTFLLSFTRTLSNHSLTPPAEVLLWICTAPYHTYNLRINLCILHLSPDLEVETSINNLQTWDLDLINNNMLELREKHCHVWNQTKVIHHPWQIFSLFSFYKHSKIFFYSDSCTYNYLQTIYVIMDHLHQHWLFFSYSTFLFVLHKNPQ